MCIRDRRRVHGEREKGSMRRIGLSVLSLLILAVAVAEDCQNPLLQRVEVFTRFGLSNVLHGPKDAGVNPICRNLQGQKVCVNDEGYLALRIWLEDYKNEILKTDSLGGHLKNLSVQASEMNLDDCIDRYISFIIFATHSLTFSYLGAPKPWNFDAAANQYEEQRAKLFNTNVSEAIRNELEKFRKPLKGVGAYTARITETKEKCAKSLFQHLVAVSCLASSANYKSVVSGTPEKPKVKISRKTCAAHRENCREFFETLEQVEISTSMVNVCKNKVAVSVQEAMKSTEKSLRNSKLMKIIEEHGVSIMNQTSKGTLQVEMLKRDITCDYFLNATSAHLHRLQSLATRQMKEIINPAQLKMESSLELTTGDDGLDMSTDAIPTNVTTIDGILGQKLSQTKLHLTAILTFLCVLAISL
eukprot:TRINITY_DN12557_c0_g1_i2.p1 TRINITY_DN12557_c0_g1~~TRINITY_DN12557_c0_g1_i2.p1  ORF type:complete len:416 (+),score=83.60 TRINITY_DN12557_c0_g1_i2:65-1312(+)